ncbi:MAG: TrkH family potassium uptake protein [Sneathia sanguinegens]|uniref:TrkH family potassium uptake protein n=1 Tax=Sneathia sanguinegens TaxID=40543 RepID=UPI0029147DD4|nr:TrkH family potassium uptake protein [Sneathia sanguinegens]MDU4652200.1 TrkH family potassium uptake protein [Sneathia sanguinegens]
MKKIKLSPYILILLSFAIMMFLGAFLLCLPLAQISGKSGNFLENLFTATSALCVTGLVVNDISITYTIFGKIVILILIQLGGLGVLTVSSMVILSISRKMGYYTKKIVSEDINYNILTEIPRYLKNVSIVVFGIEFVGAVLLFFEFSKKLPFIQAVGYSIFHSVSAFCNAGFALFSNNMENYTGNILINFVITSLIILGGLGFAAILDVYNVIKKTRRKLSTSTHLAMAMTIFLICFGAIMTFILEYSNKGTIGNLSLHDKLLSSYFQSVTLRTAGFQTVDLATLTTPTIIIYLFLMFIGASPGSTGGGLKTTTLGILLLGVMNAITGREDIEYRRRRLSWQTFNKACAILMLSLFYLFVMIIIMSIFDSSKGFLPLLFELISAFGTVGLSMGVTAKLSIISKLIIILTMYIGRVGPLTIMYALSKKKYREGKYKYPEETILIG